MCIQKCTQRVVHLPGKPVGAIDHTSSAINIKTYKVRPMNLPANVSYPKQFVYVVHYCCMKKPERECCVQVETSLFRGEREHLKLA